MKPKGASHLIALRLVHSNSSAHVVLVQIYVLYPRIWLPMQACKDATYLAWLLLIYYFILFRDLSGNNLTDVPTWLFPFCKNVKDL